MLAGAGAGCRELQGSFCEKRPGAASSQIQTAAAGSNGPTVRHSWALQPRWWHLCESVFKIRQKTAQAEWEGGGKWETILWAPRSKKEGEQILQVLEQVFPCSPWKALLTQADIHAAAAHGRPHAGTGDYFLKELWPVESPCWSRHILKDYSLARGPTQEQGKSVRRREQQREAVMDWPQPPITHLLLPLGVWR